MNRKKKERKKETQKYNTNKNYEDISRSKLIRLGDVEMNCSKNFN